MNFSKWLFLFIFTILLLSLSSIIIKSRSEIFPKNYFDTIYYKTYSNTIILPVKIGNETYNFNFDTGGSTSISFELFSKLNLTIIDSIESVDLYNNKKKVYISNLPELTIGTTTFSKIKVGIIRPIQDLTFCDVKIDGYLGNEVLSKGIVQLDYSKKILVISNRIESINVDNHKSIDFETNIQMVPFLKIKFPGINIGERVIFDTGSPNYFYRIKKSVFKTMVKNGHIKNKDIIDTLGPSLNSSSAFGKQDENEVFFVNFDSIDFVGKMFYNCPAYTFSSDYFSVLGAPFLRFGIVTIDYKNHKFYFKPYQNEIINLSPRHGFTIKGNKSNQLVVETVLKNSLAEKNGIKKNYIIKKINSLDLDSLTLCERLRIDWSAEYQGDVVKYCFLNTNNEIIEIQIDN